MTKRRTKGEGSVYKRGNGRIVGEYEDANGKKRYVSGKTKSDVSHKLRKSLHDVVNSNPREDWTLAPTLRVRRRLSTRS